MSEVPTEDSAEIAALDLELKALIRRKYKEHWHACVGRAGAAAAGGLANAELSAIQAEIKAVFDRIRLIDKKYTLPTISMHE